MAVLLKIHRVLSYLPVTWLTLTVLFVFRVYLKLGRLPRYDQPDPADLQMPIHYAVVFFGLFLVAMSLLVWLVVCLIIIIRNWKKLPLSGSVIFAGCYTAIWVLLRTDPYGLVNWLGD